jgi:hypothetical protein
MSTDLLNRPPSRPRRAVTIADRAVRLQAAAFAASHVPKIMQWWAELYQDEKQPMSVRIAASDPTCGSRAWAFHAGHRKS